MALSLPENTTSLDMRLVTAAACAPGDGTRYEFALAALPTSERGALFAVLNIRSEGRCMVLPTTDQAGVLTGEYLAEHLGLHWDRDRYTLVAALRWLGQQGYAIHLDAAEQRIVASYRRAS